jgi:bacterioferritin-associated ferredoxin
MYVCLCKGLTDSDVKDIARAGHTTAEALIGALGLEDPECCGRCALDIDDFVALAQREWSGAIPVAPHHQVASFVAA